jgi:hypothetical protein
MKAQKRDNENRSKVEEARKKNSVMRVLNSHGSSSRETVETSTRSGYLIDMGEHSGELSSRYSPEMDTLPSDVASPTMSPMQSMQTPLSIDQLNTLKAMQTLNALSQMNQMNHYNTLNHLNILSSMPTNNSNNSTNNNTNDINNDTTLNSPPPPPHYTHGHTVINHYNTNLSTYSNSAYNLPPEMATPMARFPPLNSQQIFVPMAYNPMMSPPPPQASPYSSYFQQPPVKDYTSVNTHTGSTHHNYGAPSSHYSHYHSQVHPQAHTHAHTFSHHSTSSLLYPSHNLIPNPMHQQHHNLDSPDDDDDETSITGGGQM